MKSKYYGVACTVLVSTRGEGLRVLRRSLVRAAPGVHGCARVLWLVGLLATFALTAPAVAAGNRRADLVLTGTHIITMDKEVPVAEAVAVRGDRIVAVGTNQEIAAWIGPATRVLRLPGHTVVPGFIDAHGHFMGLGQSKMMLDLTTATTWARIVQQVAAAARKTPPGKWIVGRGWHQNKWTRPPHPNVEGCPVHDALSRAAPHNPVLLTHASGHMCIVNQRAMDIAGLDRDTPDPAGGQILHTATGAPTGVLRENAMGLVRRCYTEAQNRRSPEQKRRDQMTALRLAADECLRNGITSFEDAGSSFATIDFFKQLAEQGKLPLRLWVMVLEDNRRLARHLDAYRMIGVGNHHLTVRAIKRFMDGALGSHGAWLLAPYDDLPTSSGLNTLAVEDLEKTAQLAIRHGYQLCVHAIGDRANRAVLDVYERTFRAYPDKHDLRWRIEHAQHLDPADIPRFAELGVIASMQFVHATSDGPFVVQRLGRRRARQGAYAWRSLMKAGAIIANGTDAPVEPVNPLAGLYAGSTRKMADGNAFFPEQRLTRRQALRCYTLNAAYAAFEESLKGSITPGKLADFAVLSADPLAVPETQLRDIRVHYTIVGGRIVYQATNSADERR